MPQKQRVTPEIILDSTFALFRREGMEAINARSIAREAKCSTQPVFSCFANLGVIKDEMEHRAVQLFMHTLTPALESANALEEGCCAYLRFAAEEGKAFLHLFVKTDLGRGVLFEEGGLYSKLLSVMAEREGLDTAKAKELVDAACLYANGMAFLLAAGTTPMTAEEACGRMKAMLEKTREQIR